MTVDNSSSITRLICLEKMKGIKVTNVTLWKNITKAKKKKNIRNQLNKDLITSDNSIYFTNIVLIPQKHLEEKKAYTTALIK